MMVVPEPMSLVLLAFGSLTVCVRRPRTRRSGAYDMTSNASGTCPECGEEVRV